MDKVVYYEVYRENSYGTGEDFIGVVEDSVTNIELIKPLCEKAKFNGKGVETWFSVYVITLDFRTHEKTKEFYADLLIKNED